jgi:DNA-binding IclR family transcriptional regulator
MFEMGNGLFERERGNGRESLSAVAKANRILEAVSTDGAAGVSEIARRTGLSKSTVHGLLSALVAERFLVGESPTRSYRLGPRLLELGMRSRDQMLLQTAESQLQELVERNGETALFGRLEGGEVLILALEDSPRSLNLSAQAGARVPLMAGALGKAYLASLPEGEGRLFLQHIALPSYTDRSVKDIRSYLDEVRKASDIGYAVDRGEYLAGVSAVAASFPWFGSYYFLWIVQIEARQGRVELEQLGAEVQNAVREMEERLAEAESTHFSNLTSNEKRSRAKRAQT